MLCALDQSVGQGRHHHQLANYGLSGARHCLDIEQADCKMVALFARRHEGDIRVHFGSCPNGRHVMEFSSMDASIVAVGEIGLQDVLLCWSSHADFLDDLYALSSSTFWKECEDAEALIKPLTITSFCLQRD
ncbi:unnamed protein product [Sphagnum jensenii]|uniref:Uncharacterized protein n=1 Tax=Sphagnum jensenii TaxID=128206 RepID=A0ABP1B258_9BRYO